MKVLNLLNSLYTGYSLAEEARNTAYNRRGMRGVDARLRHQPVTFVSAGLMDPLKDLEVEQEKFNHPDQVDKIDKVEKTEMAELVEEVEEAPLPQVTVTGDSAQNTISHEGAEKVAETFKDVAKPAPLFTLDLAGDKSLRPNRETLSNTESATGPVDESDSSEEVILFKGRDTTRQNRTPAEPTHSRPVAGQHNNEAKDPLEFREMSQELRVVENSLPKSSENSRTQEHNHRAVPQKADVKSSDGDYLSLSTANKRGKGWRNASGRNTGKGPGNAIRGESPDAIEDEEAAIIADYIANMQADNDTGDASDNRQPSIDKHAFNVTRDLGGTDSEAVPNEVTSDGDTSDDSPNDESSDGSDQRRRRDFDDFPDDTISDGSDQRRRRELDDDDEQMALMLAKQEELGLGDDDVLNDADSDYDEDDLELASKTTPRRRKKGSSKQAQIVQRKGQYPSATEMADAFDDLDLVMDWHRPSLNNFKKQPKSFNVSDSELEVAMNLTYQKDRQKKAEKKKAREELRSQGLLGKNVKPDDLRVKYRGGMSLDDLANELEAFLIGTQEE